MSAADSQDTSSDLRVITDHNDYVIVEDARIPLRVKHNVIFRASAMQIIAEHYFEKYHVMIQVVDAPTTIDVLAERIAQTLAVARATQCTHQVGFIFIDQSDRDDLFGHALPMIWEHDAQQEHLFFLDTCQFPGNGEKVESIQFREQLKQLLPQLQLWSIFGCRQFDYSSCYTDALVVLKDALRSSSFKALVERRVNTEVSTASLTIFFAPPVLLKTAQIGSFIRKSQVSDDQALRDFRQKYDITVLVRNEPKSFGTFAFFKAIEYVQLIERKKIECKEARIRAQIQGCLGPVKE